MSFPPDFLWRLVVRQVTADWRSAIGLERNSLAPPRIAFTVVGTSSSLPQPKAGVMDSIALREPSGAGRRLT